MTEKNTKPAKPKMIAIRVPVTEAQHDALQDIRFTERHEKLASVVGAAIDEFLAKRGKLNA